MAVAACPDGEILHASCVAVAGRGLLIAGASGSGKSALALDLMAFGATARGTWGCLPEHYPAVVDHVLSGRVHVAPFIEARPMAELNETFEALHRHELKRRPVMIP